MKKLTITLALALCLCGSALAELDTMPVGWNQETSVHGSNNDSTSEPIIESHPEGYGREVDRNRSVVPPKLRVKSQRPGTLVMAW